MHIIADDLDRSEPTVVETENFDKASHQVVIAGGGPTGLMLAGELALAGIDVAIIERRETQTLAGMRAGGLHIRTLETFDQRGIGDRFADQGQRYPAAPFHGQILDISDLPTRRNYFLALSQNHIESILAGWIQELAVKVYRGQELAGFEQDDQGVNITLASGWHLKADYLVGCDGARSLVRKGSGIEFAGWDPTKSWLIAEAEWTHEPEWGIRQASNGSYALGKMDDPKLVRIVLVEPELKVGDQPSLQDVSAALVSVYGTDFGIHNPVWVSRFTDRCRQAVTYRDRRVFLAGDAAHIHPPMGGQGLNLGVQDAANLGWKLAQVVKGVSADELLDTYQSERHPVAARVLLGTMADVALQRQDEHTSALGTLVSELAQMDGPRQHIMSDRSGLSVHYEMGEGHPVLGRRMPDLEFETGDGLRTAYTYLTDARPVLFVFDEHTNFHLGGGSDNIHLVRARYDGEWLLPAIGAVEPVGAVLVRPDGYVVWAGNEADGAFTNALAKWFGSTL
jgi:3-(3-hydroxy-phenyl)propionate hydroxylase